MEFPLTITERHAWFEGVVYNIPKLFEDPEEHFKEVITAVYEENKDCPQVKKMREDMPEVDMLAETCAFFKWELCLRLKRLANQFNLGRIDMDDFYTNPKFLEDICVDMDERRIDAGIQYIEREESPVDRLMQAWETFMAVYDHETPAIIKKVKDAKPHGVWALRFGDSDRSMCIQDIHFHPSYPTMSMEDVNKLFD